MSTIDDNNYANVYLKHLLQNRIYYLHIYADLLAKLINDEAINQSKLLDIGSGNGLFGLFAKYTGVSVVLLAEPDKSFIESSKKISQQLSISIDGFINKCGEDLELNEISGVQHVAGVDMIEHVYDLNIFLKKICANSSLERMVFSTAANPENPFIRMKLKKIQIKDELLGDQRTNAAQLGITSMPYIEVRQQMIQSYFPNLDKGLISTLARHTRGMRRDDIISAVKEYVNIGKLPTPAPGDNTCDPITGSWSERLCPLSWYADAFVNVNFTTEFSPGFYNQWYMGWRGVVKKLLNKTVDLSGLIFSPYFVIHCSKKSP